MMESLSRTTTNGSTDELKNEPDGAPLSAVYSASSNGSTKHATSTSTTSPPRLGARAPSGHSLLGGHRPADLRRKPHTTTDKTMIERASISMPPPMTKPAADRRLSATMHSIRLPRKSDDGPRTSPISIKPMDERQLFANNPSALVSTTATDSTHVTTASTGVPPSSGLPVLSPPALPQDVPDQFDLAGSQTQTPTSPVVQTPITLSLKPEAAQKGGVLPSRVPRSNPRSISSTRRLSTPSQKSVDTHATQEKSAIGTIGVCALDVKARSKPSRQILTRLQGEGEYEVVVFGDKAILDEDVKNWPICDFLIAFFSEGFPLDKAIEYVKLRKPFVVNDLPMQKVLWDRRLCLRILDQMQVPTPKRVEVNRDGGPTLDSPEMAQHLKNMSGVTLQGNHGGTGGTMPAPHTVEMSDDDTLVVDGKSIRKPFVEKPVSGEDHNIIIYFPRSHDGGGGRRLFRKIGNKSSEWDPKLIVPRCITEPQESFIYEQFLKTENAEDVKAYTVGPDFCHAETRKSPVVDGLVKRNTHGKEVRYVTTLSATEKEMAARVSRGFGQRICGFDLLRANGQSYVIDVNGWSFVKDNERYYNECAKILKGMFSHERYKSDGRTTTFADDTSSDGAPDHPPRRDTTSGGSVSHSHRHALKAVFKSPSISKLSQHLAHSKHHQISPSSPKSSTMTTPISSPPTVERAGTTSLPGAKIPESDGFLPPPSIPTSAISEPDLAGSSVSPAEQADVVETPAPLPSSKHSWKLKGVVTVIRHADRTPKQKIKFTAHSQVFVDLLKGHHEEVLLKGEAALASVEAAVRTAQRENLEDQEKLRNLRNALARKRSHPATKVQIKPMFRKRRPEEKLPETVDATSLETSIPEHAEVNIPQSPASPPAGDGLAKTPTRSDSISVPTFSRYSAAENDLVLDKLQLVMKWGGEPTHSARYQSADLGANMRDDFKLLNRKVLDDVRIFTSSEKRVRTSAQIWAAAFLGRDDISEDSIHVRKDLLDDSNAAKDVMDKVKKKLKHLLRQGNSVPEEFAWPKDVPEPFVVMQTVIELMRFHRKVMRYNFKKLGGSAVASLAAINNSEIRDASQRDAITLESIQARWCTGEDAELFKERWEKLFAEFCDSDKADPSKVSELYDTMKYDALHNKPFLEWVFTPSQSVIDEFALEEATDSQLASPEEEKEDPKMVSERKDSASTLAPGDRPSIAHKIGFRRRSVMTHPPLTPPLNTNESYFQLFRGDAKSKQDKRLDRLHQLYRYAKILFDYIGPQEYGISDHEKLEIGLLTSLPLLREIVQDLEELQATGDAKSFVYFTKESHIYTLLNCIMEGGIETKIKRSTIPELDYLSQICFELYEAQDSDTRESSYSIRISISPGAHTSDPLDVTLDSKHVIGSAPRRTLTNHQPWKEVVATLKAKFDTVELPKSFIAVNVSAQHEEDSKGAGELLNEDDSQIKSFDRSVNTMAETDG